MVSLRTSLPLALALVGLAPSGVWAMTCECSDTSAPSTLCSVEAEGRCETIEDCASLLPLSRAVTVHVQPPSARAELAAPRLSWCERASDPECSAADPENERTSRVATSPVSLCPSLFSVPPQGGAVMRSATVTKTVTSLVGEEPAERLDRPPR